MLVKIQRIGENIRISDKLNSHIYEGPVSQEAAKFLGANTKVYALADLVYKRKNGKSKKRWNVYRISVRQDYNW